MGSSEILRILRKSEIKLTSLEIADIISCSLGAVNQTLNRLKKDTSECLMSRALTPEEKENRYGHKQGCRVNIFWLEDVDIGQDG